MSAATDADAEADAPAATPVADAAAAATGGTDGGVATAADGAAGPARSFEAEVHRRRTLAIISHPDAGKTTLTERLLLYAGAIQKAGAVRARGNQRRTTSDFMAIEQQRGISVASTVMTFEYGDNLAVLLDTPGHEDFAEDSFRALTATDNVVMLIDAAKGLEDRTRKLFEVCRLRKLPTMTFVNKMDRPAMSAFEICDQIEAEFGLACLPIVWPIGDGDRFRGVYERSTQLVHLFGRADRTGKADDLGALPIDDPRVLEIIGEEALATLREEIDILDSCGHTYDADAVAVGDMTPMFFGSAMTNFGVELFLKRFIELGLPPTPRESSGGAIDPCAAQFSAFCFKISANMDRKHRDRVAFVRVCSGTFVKGMKVNHSRMPGKTLALTRPTQLFASERETVDVAYPGDIVGLTNPGTFAIGDTVYTGGTRVVFPGIPAFSPELFAYIKNADTGKYKNFNKGLSQLLEEGAVQLLYPRGDDGQTEPVLAAVGALQFDVVQQRLRDEYGVETRLEPLSYSVARWVVGPGDDPWEALDAAGRLFNVMYAKDRWGRPVLLFKNVWNLSQLATDAPDLELQSWSFAPDDVVGRK